MRAVTIFVFYNHFRWPTDCGLTVRRFRRNKFHLKPNHNKIEWWYYSPVGWTLYSKYITTQAVTVTLDDFDGVLTPDLRPCDHRIDHLSPTITVLITCRGLTAFCQITECNQSKHHPWLRPLATCHPPSAIASLCACSVTPLTGGRRLDSTCCCDPFSDYCFCSSFFFFSFRLPWSHKLDVSFSVIMKWVLINNVWTGNRGKGNYLDENSHQSSSLLLLIVEIDQVMFFASSSAAAVSTPLLLLMMMI